MSDKITSFFSPIQGKVKITSNTTKNDGNQIKHQKTKECSVSLKDCFEEIENGKFKKLKFGPNVKNPIKINQNQTKMKPKKASKLTIKKYEKKCETCNKIFNNCRDYNGHKCSYKCKFCDNKFSLKANIYRHMKKMHQNKIKTSNVKQFECDFCGKFFMAKECLKIHMGMHLPKVNCSICQAELRCDTLNQHMKNVHAKGTNFQCQACDKAFKSKKSLSIHEKSHDKKFECKVCSKRFIKNSLLNTHINLYHLNPKSFSCDICDKKFTYKSSLKKHQKIHDKNRPKPFKCQRCDYACDNKHAYEKHMNVHKRQDEKIATMKNPVKCEKCPTLCKNNRSLWAHMNNVHPKEIFQCDLCGKYIKTKQSLTNHIKLHIENRINS